MPDFSNAGGWQGVVLGRLCRWGWIVSIQIQSHETSEGSDGELHIVLLMP